MLVNDLKSSDLEVFDLIKSELNRQRSQIQLIASENFTSTAIMEAQSSVMTNKYAEGYAGKRYYCGCEWVDKIEILAIDRLCKIFDCRFANVQPHSGSQANQAVFAALLKPGDTILGLSLACGGHLTHGALPNMSGKWFNAVHYDVDPINHLIDMDAVEKLALEHKPALIIAGASAYSRVIDFAHFRKIADRVGALLLADIAHYSGLIAAGLYPSPISHAHVVTSTTHKTLRGPRGGIIMTNYEDIYKKIQSAIFPGIQGGPLMNSIAAKAVAFGEVLSPSFKRYMERVLENSQILAETLSTFGFDIVTKGTDSHMVLVDLRSKNLKGRDAVNSLERAGITCNKNAVPFDEEKPTITSGLRFGSPAETSRGLGKAEFEHLGKLINTVLDGLIKNPHDNSNIEKLVNEEIQELCSRFPLYPSLKG